MDIGEKIYNLTASGEIEWTPSAYGWSVWYKKLNFELILDSPAMPDKNFPEYIKIEGSDDNVTKIYTMYAKKITLLIQKMNKEKEEKRKQDFLKHIESVLEENE